MLRHIIYKELQKIISTEEGTCSVPGKQTLGNSTEKQLQDSIENSPEALEMKQLQDSIENSPEALEMKQLQDSIENSPEALEMKQLQDSIENSPENIEMQLLNNNVQDKRYEEEVNFTILKEGVDYVYLSPNETLASIAKENELTVSTITKLNPTAASHATTLPIGMRILISTPKTREEIKQEEMPAIDQKITIVFLSGLAMSVSDSSESESSESSQNSNSSESGSSESSSHHSGSNSSGYTSDYEDAIRNAIGENENIKIRSYKSEWNDDHTKIAVTDFISENADDGSKLIIVGYSWGGDTALELAQDFNKLEDNKTIIDLLITIDPADGWTEGDSIVPSNVLNVANYYQPTLQGTSKSGNTSLTLESDNNITQGFNSCIDKTEQGEKSNHSNIYDDVMDDVVQDIQDFILNTQE